MALPTYVSLTEVVNALPFSYTHIKRLIKSGDFPQPVQLGERRVAFNEQDIHDWLESKRDGAAA